MPSSHIYWQYICEQTRNSEQSLFRRIQTFEFSYNNYTVLHQNGFIPSISLQLYLIYSQYFSTNSPYKYILRAIYKSFIKYNKSRIFQNKLLSIETSMPLKVQIRASEPAY